MQPSALEKYKDIIFNSDIKELNLNVSIKSKFNDDIWDFNDNSKIRMNSVTPAKLRINWKEFDILPDKIINRVKQCFFYYVKVPYLFSSRKTTSDGYKPNTLTSRFKYFLNTMIDIYREYEPESIIIGENPIKSFSDIKLSDFQSLTFNNKVQVDHLKKILRSLCQPVMKKDARDIYWNTNDINNLRLKVLDKKDKVKSYSSKPLEDILFRFLIKNTTQDIVIFLKLMDIEPYYNYESEIEHPSFKKNTFKGMFKDYCNIREDSKERSINKGKRTHESYSKPFLNKFSTSISEFNEFLIAVHQAAILSIYMFTGVRYSESISFKNGCLKQIKEDLWIIRGTITKNEAIEKSEDNTEWVACPIVRDSVRVLEIIQRVSFNDYLISSTNSVYLNVENAPYSNASINEILNLYLQKKDKEKKFTGPKNRLNTHRLRHTLAKNLIKAKLGIPYITDHLKHIHSYINQIQNEINNVTIGYGGISQELFEQAEALNTVKKELIYDIYHPEAPVAGKNIEDFKNRRKAFFSGMQAEGFTIDEILELLSAKGVPFADVGLGYCGGKKSYETKSGEMEKPPCVGQLKCNPAQCHNAIIPKNKKAIWEQVYNHNKKMVEDPHFEHVKKEHLSFMTEAKSVLDILNDD